jgi:hypothetical protein
MASRWRGWASAAVATSIVGVGLYVRRRSRGDWHKLAVPKGSLPIVGCWEALRVCSIVLHAAASCTVARCLRAWARMCSTTQGTSESLPHTAAVKCALKPRASVWRHLWHVVPHNHLCWCKCANMLTVHVASKTRLRTPCLGRHRGPRSGERPGPPDSAGPEPCRLVHAAHHRCFLQGA